MDIKVFLGRTNEIRETFQKVREELNEAMYSDNFGERINKFWNAEEKLFDEVYLKYHELGWDLYHENKALRKEVKSNE
jgi:hypothetical protein